MAKVKFRDIRLSASNKDRLASINGIIAEYRALGLRLTLRQLYYQLVSRDIIPNQQKEYKKLSIVLLEGRMSGIVDWDAIEDRLRVVEKPPSWNSPQDIMTAAINGYEKPRLKGQKNYIEVWVEKDALSGVLSQVTEPYHVPIMVNRGYSSVSAMYNAYERFAAALKAKQKIVLLYLGDFDPSGLDMIRDVLDRPMEMLLAKARDYAPYKLDRTKKSDAEFARLYRLYKDDERAYVGEGAARIMDPWRATVLDSFEVISIALTRDQIDEYDPPPNPAKVTDPRAAKFMAEHGDSSWEVDALRPEVLNTILTEAIESRLDLDKYNEILEEEQADIDKLNSLKDSL